MSEVENAIRRLVFENGKSSSEMTHDFNVLGHGDMQNGIKYLVEFFMDEGWHDGYKYGVRTGAIRGVAGSLLAVALLAGGHCIAERHKINKFIDAHKKEGIKILRVMKQETSEEMQEAEEKTEQ